MGSAEDIAISIGFSILADRLTKRFIVNPPSNQSSTPSVPPNRRVDTAVGIQGGGDLSVDRTHSLTDTGVTPGVYTYSNIVVNPQGRIELAESGAQPVLPIRRIDTSTGLQGGGDLSVDRIHSLSDTAVAPGIYTNATITVDQQGRITLAASGVQSDGVEIGSGGLWFTDTPPPKYIILDGTNRSRITYPLLFALWGTFFGVGDGATTFGTPDIRQCVPMGKSIAGTESTLGATGGTIDHTHNSPIVSSVPSATVNVGILGVLVPAPTVGHTHSISLPSSNQKFFVVNFIVKAQ